MSEAFGAYARYYDLLYRDKDYAAEARYVHGLIQRYAPGAGTILELGCGTGAHAAQFAELGYEVLGVDASEGMLEKAQERRGQLSPDLAKRLDFSPGDVRSFRAHRRFDVVTALFHVVSYQVSDQDLAATFATASAHLAPGGVFLFDCWYGPAVLADPPVKRVKKLEDADTRIRRVATPTMYFKEKVTSVDYQVQVTDVASGRVKEILEQHRVRYLFEPELEQYARAEALEPVHFSEWMSDGRPSDSTWNVVMVARAMQNGEA